MSRYNWQWGALGVAWAAATLGCSAAKGAAAEDVGVAQQGLYGTPIPQHPGCTYQQSQFRPTTLSTLYVAVGGNDDASNPGTSISQPLATLAGAQARISTAKDYLIYVRGGEYRGQTVVWTKTFQDYSVHIEAYENETPIFNGAASGSLSARAWLFDVRLPVGRAGGNTDLNFVVKGLTLKNYVDAGVMLNGNADAGSGTHTCSTFVDNTLFNIGDSFGDCTSAGALTGCVEEFPGWGCKCIGFGGFDVMLSSKNYFLNNKVINAHNDPSHPGSRSGLIHGFYLYQASDNIVRNNYLRSVGGNPMQVRDNSNDNKFIDNYLERTGDRYFFADVIVSGKTPPEIYGERNSMSGNVATFPYTLGPIDLRNEGAPYFTGTGQDSPSLFQGATPSLEVPTAVASADIDNDGREEVFVAFYYPNEHFTKVVYSQGGSRELSEVAYVSSFWRVDHLVAGTFGGLGANVIADFYNPSNGHTQVALGALDGDGKFKLGTGPILLNSTGASGWKVSAMAAGKVAGATQTQLFSAFSSGGVQQIVRGDGFTGESGGMQLGFNGGGTLYSSSDWQIPAMTTGNIDGTGVIKLIGAFYRTTGAAKTALYLGSGSGSNGANDGGRFWESTTLRVNALTTGKFDGSQERLVTAASSGTVGKVYLSSGTSPINPTATALYSNSGWTTPAASRTEVNTASGGDELVTAFDRSANTQVWFGDGTTALTGAANDGDALYRWP